MNTLEATTLAASQQVASALASQQLNGSSLGQQQLSGSGTAAAMMLMNISEEDELKLLNFPNKREDLTTAIPLTVIFALLLITGCIGNICTAIVIAKPKNKYMHTATNYYLFSLAMSDFLFLILGLPQEMYTLWSRYPYIFGESFCIIRGYLSEASTYASILTISAFTMERYVAICHPLWAHTMSQLPRAITSIIIIWILAAICAIPPAAELGIIMQTGPITNRTLEQSAQCATKRTIFANMFVVSAIFFFIVPMIIVTVLYILIAIELRRSSKMNSAISKQATSAATLLQAQSSNSFNCCDHNHHRQKQQQHRYTIEPEPVGHSAAAARAPLLNNQQLLVSSMSICPMSNGSRSPSVSSHQPHNNHPKALNHDVSLMADLMAQRPSSAIGNERLNAQPKSSFSKHIWPTTFGLFWSASNPKITIVPSNNHCCNCTCFANGGQPHHLMVQQSHSHQLQSVSSRNESPESSVPQRQQQHQHQQIHSPLSYHESLIQRQIKAAAATQDSTAPLKQAVPKHRPLPQHQMSLTHLPSYSTSHQQAVGQQADLSHQLLLPAVVGLTPVTVSCCRRSHHHHHHPQALSQPMSAASRRSAAASSKKSVIRMLVAVVVSFFICWVPFHAQRLLASYLVKDENQNQVLLDIYLKLTYISGVMYYLSSTINPLLYQLMSAKFRLAFKETFKCSLFKCKLLRGSSTNSNHRNPQSTKLKQTGHGISPTNSVKDAAGQPHHQAQVGSQLIEPSSILADCSYCQQANQLDCVSTANANETNNAIQIQFSDIKAMNGQPASYMNRLRVRLNSSLVSLFRTNDTQLNQGNCCCCCANSGHIHHRQQHQQPPRSASAVNYYKYFKLPFSRRNSANERASALSSRENSIKINNSSAAAANLDKQTAAVAAAAVSSTTPLLLENNHSIAEPNNHSSGKLTLLASQTAAPSSPPPPPPQLPHQNTTMLKFIKRGPEVSLGSGIALTRLSSREEDDDDEAPPKGTAAAEAAEGAPKEQQEKPVAKPIKRDVMEALIRGSELAGGKLPPAICNANSPAAVATNGRVYCDILL